MWVESVEYGWKSTSKDLLIFKSPRTDVEP